jgi:succinate dehydrogenase / fumarate reductase cytochrome b subunit
MSCSCTWWSSVGRKWITGITGLGLVLFLVLHLAGNLTLFAGPEVFNAYAHFLATAGHGALMIAGEAGLLLFFGFHIVAGVRVAISRGRARPTEYAVRASKGGPSRQTASSGWMILSGSALLLFLILHVAHFKFGPTRETADGMRDLYTLVVQEFQKFPQMFLYVLFMTGLALHLRHGVWSALQSVGAIKPRLQTAVYTAAGLLGVLLAVGFLLLPVIIFFFFPQPI